MYASFRWILLRIICSTNNIVLFGSPLACFLVHITTIVNHQVIAYGEFDTMPPGIGCIFLLLAWVSRDTLAFRVTTVVRLVASILSRCWCKYISWLFRCFIIMNSPRELKVCVQGDSSLIPKQLSCCHCCEHSKIDDRLCWLEEDLVYPSLLHTKAYLPWATYAKLSSSCPQSMPPVLV